MIDLRKRGLPDSIEVDGKAVPVLTDFRVWIAWLHDLEAAKRVPLYIFPEGVELPPRESWLPSALEFAKSPSATPKAKNASRDKAFDFVLDGDYIAASFMQAYGIDLTECEMHWHLFKALFMSLPGDTKMAQIMGYRLYNPADAKKKHETVQASLKDAWKLPSADDAAIIERQKELFGELL